MSQNYTTQELREFLRVRNLSTTGEKSILKNRLEKFDKNIWSIIAEEKNRETERDLRKKEEKQRRTAVSAHDRMQNYLMQRELALSRKENEILRRELELVRREQVLSKNSDASRVGGPPAKIVNVSIQDICVLLPDFYGDEQDADEFYDWEDKIQAIRGSYRLDENAMRVLVRSKLKGDAEIWFNSNSEHLRLKVEDLLLKMGVNFNCTHCKDLSLRKEFKSRVYCKASEERLYDYCEDKIILGKRVPLADDELLKAVIFGIQDSDFRSELYFYVFCRKLVTTTSQFLDTIRAFTLAARNLPIFFGNKR